MTIPFNIPYTCVESFDSVQFLVNNPETIALKTYTSQCQQFFENVYVGHRAFLTPSCTRSMELVAMSMDINLGDEIIMPSYGYVGVANAFANCGATPVFADILPKTMNIDPESIERCITPRTKAVVIVHYAGVACDTALIRRICDDNGLILIEDNAQGIGCLDGDLPLGSFGDYSCISFDQMKNVNCGEGGLLLCKDHLWPKLLTAFDNGTNRHAFELKKIERYEWVGSGSKFDMSEFSAAILLPLLQKSKSILDERRQVWKQLHDRLSLASVPSNFLPATIAETPHNGHIFFVKCKDEIERSGLMRHLSELGIACAFHFSPLHSSQRAKAENWTIDKDEHTTLESGRLLRLPVFNRLDEEGIDRIASAVATYFSHL